VGGWGCLRVSEDGSVEFHRLLGVVVEPQAGSDPLHGVLLRHSMAGEVASAWPDSLSEGRQIGLRPFRIDDELERVQTLMLDPEPVERLPPALREPTARRVIQ